ncbi:peptidoglycan D,D-transpeptidase FtsI family protein [Actinoallomurus soli]|uniref:peptidoglycan D,D-transpeptidase FtsI family protein n=1 Tax=Actinoallomurus soli TaxID=2952535 RepID=UPI0020929C48|nr:penicillin-binding protein 2 [Actinoallomurus soli]MCO5974232.1 penicillin-binding protein 2 [Actinoallomurus soli]
MTIFSLLLVLALMVNVTYIQGAQEQKLRDDPLNARHFLEQFNRNRGPIMAGGTVIARSRDTGQKDFRYQREYPESEVFAPITGYFAPSGGVTGVEAAADSLLSGTDPRLTVQHWFDAIVGRTNQGATVHTTIDPAAQRATYDALRTSTSRRAAAVAIDVKTGAIKVMASYPSFDANSIAVHDTTASTKAYDRLLKASGSPLIDKAIDESFAPGSTFKIITAAAGMDKQGLNENSPVDTPGVLTLPSGNPLHNDADSGPCNGGQLPLITAFAQSCNSTFGKLALDMGQKALGAEASGFGFGQHIPIESDLRSAASVYPKNMGGDDVGRSGIGQGSVSATPLQMALAAAAVAHGGVVMKPYLIQRITAPDQSEIEAASPKELFHATSAQTASQLRDMMREVVASGTGAGRVSSDIAGKTGTAETGLSYNERWFAGFAPADNPQIAFAVVTEGSGFGADAAGPIVDRMVQALGVH